MHLPRIHRALRPLASGLLALGLPAQDGARLRVDLEQLTAPEFEGRGIGTAGGELAIRYLAGAMDAAGLRPWIEGDFRQEFELRSRHATFTTGSSLSLSHGDRFRPLRLGIDAVPFGFSANGDVRAEVVFAGYGLQIPALGHADYAGLDVRGKVVLVLRGPDASHPDSPYAAHRRELWFLRKAQRAQAAGAAGLLLCEADPTADGAGPENLAIALRTQGRVGIPALWITRGVAVGLGAGAGGFRARARRLLAGDPAARGVIPGVEVELALRMGPVRPPLRTANVIGWLPGADPDLAGEYVVVGAHHDHLGRGQRGSLGGPAAVGAIHPGADDNASGVAALLELARVLAAGPRPSRSVLFAAFGAKEQLHAGSRHFLEATPAPAQRLVAMINLDMVGRAESCGLRIEDADSGTGLRKMLEELVRGTALPVRLGRGSSPRSDHKEFLQKGIPSLLFHTGIHDQYRRPSDVACLVQIEGAAEVVRLLQAVVRELASRRSRPAFAADRRRD